MKNYCIAAIITCFIIIACHEKKETANEPAISAISIFKGQVNHIDTSLYQIVKYEIQEGKRDTSFLKREEARALAADFLALPDISLIDFAENYTEERLLDAEQNLLSITATAKNEKLEIRKQIIIVQLNDFSTGNVQSIYIDRLVQIKDSTTEQKLFWQIDKFFQIGNIIHAGNLPEKIKTVKVTWE